MFATKNIVQSVLNSKRYLRPSICNVKRTLLTQEYYCYDQWDKHLLNDAVKKIGDVNSLAFDIESRLTNKKLVTPLDMDLLATKIVYIEQFNQLEYIENVFTRFRKTQPALYVRDSMHYSFARSYLDLNQADRLLQILKLKYKYGLFVDSYTANMLIDYFLRKGDLKKAALASHEVMLQEYTDNELSLAYSLLSCVKYVDEARSKNSDELDAEPEKPEESDDQKPQKVLVYFLRKDYKDEHFDLQSLKKLCGKTIYFASSNLKSMDPALANTLKIFGLVLYEKYEKAAELLEKCLADSKGKIHSFAIDEFKAAFEKVSKNEAEAKQHAGFVQKWTALQELLNKENAKKSIILDNDKKWLKNLESLVAQVEKAQIPADIKKQTELIAKWTQEHLSEYSKQVHNHLIDETRERILKRLDDLERVEEELTYFDKENEITNTYYLKGFPEESPKDIPIEPEQTEFKEKYEKHFKPWPKYMNRPLESLVPSEEQEYAAESLRKIYLSKEKAAAGQAKQANKPRSK